ncbi:MAG: TolC family protein [Planctomycetota bacterium]|jgi:outer membrane protein TolC|nr:TolC family protein [Planctomycetota bacterium]
MRAFYRWLFLASAVVASGLLATALFAAESPAPVSSATALPATALPEPPEWEDAAFIEKLIGATAIDTLVNEKIALPPTLDQAAEHHATALSLDAAVWQVLQNNLNLQSVRLAPEKSEQAVRAARAAFDPTFSASAGYDLLDHQHSGATETYGNAASGGVGITEKLPTGTTVKVGADWNGQAAAPRSRGEWELSGAGSVTQKLLKGRGLDINLISVRQARLDAQISRYQLRDAVEDALAQTEDNYWDLVLAREAIVIRQEALNLAGERLRETEEKINVGKLAPADIAQARGDVAEKFTNLLAARHDYDRFSLEMLARLNPSSRRFQPLAVAAMPVAPVVELDRFRDHVALGLRERPDLNESRLRLQRGELEVKRTRDGLLPDLDLTITVGGGGGGSRAGWNWTNNDEFAVGGRLDFSQPLGRRQEKAAHRRAEIDAAQARLALENLQLQITVDIRLRYLSVKRYQREIATTALAVKQYELALVAMREKFRVGAATSLDVATAELQYTESRLRAAQAVINTIKELTGLYRADGSLLTRRGVRVEE